MFACPKRSSCGDEQLPVSDLNRSSFLLPQKPFQPIAWKFFYATAKVVSQSP